MFIGLAPLSCAGSHASLDNHPWLAPGFTTVENLRAARATQATAAAASDSSSSGPKLVGLASLVNALLDGSSRVAASRERYRAAIARVPQASTLPRPKLSYTYLPMPVETRVGPNEHRIQLVQAIPSPPLLAARADRAHELARVAGATHDRVVRDEIIELKLRWADLYYTARAVQIVAQNEAIAQTLAAIGAERYGQQRGALFDVVKAQSQLAQLGYDRMRLSELLETTAARLNASLGRGASAPIAAPTALPDIEVAMSEEELLEIALVEQQELHALDARIRAADAGRSAAAASWWPDFSVGVSYLVNGPAGMPGVADSGEDALGVTIGITLPIWFGDNVARADEADAEMAAALHDKKAHLDVLEARLRDLLLRERDARRLRVLYDTQLLPQAERAMETAEQWHRADATRFTDFLEARATWYAFALAREKAVSEQFKAVARLEQLIGATLAPRRGEGSP